MEDRMDTHISAREWYERGRTLRQNKMYDQALADLQQATKDPNYAGQAFTQTALCLRALGRHEDAVAALRYALDSSSISPNESLHVLYLLGQSLESLGRYAEAIEAYNWVRQEDAGFLDVETKIKNLCGARQNIFARPVKAADLVNLGRSIIGRLGNRRSG
jgi:tetratricopeptide (TPR) repeat protein